MTHFHHHKKLSSHWSNTFAYGLTQYHQAGLGNAQVFWDITQTKGVWGSFSSWAEPHPLGLGKFLNSPVVGQLDSGWCNCSLKALRWIFEQNKVKKKRKCDMRSFQVWHSFPFILFMGRLQATLHCNNEKCAYIYIYKTKKTSLPYLFSQVKCFCCCFTLSPLMYQLNIVSAFLKQLSAWYLSKHGFRQAVRAASKALTPVPWVLITASRYYFWCFDLIVVLRMKCCIWLWFFFCFPSLWKLNSREVCLFLWLETWAINFLFPPLVRFFFHILYLAFEKTLLKNWILLGSHCKISQEWQTWHTRWQ